ncbi:MAG: PQQ-binding-like beta-propeller repeat protein [Planctomycetia bacterium]|jgi:outer membrane protein assembly factor BamB
MKACSNRILTALLLAFLLGTAVSAMAENWPTWRGPNYNGSTSEKGLPIEWGAADDEKTVENIVWMCDLPEYGRNTPIVWGDAIFLTAQKEDQLQLLKIDKRTGRIEWTRTVGHGQAKPSKPVGKKGDARRHQRFHQEHNMASPSCATDGKHVVAHFGNGDLAVYDFAGNRLWKKNLQEEYGPFTVWWGHANSPILYGDSVIATVIQDSCDDLAGKPSESYIVSFDLATGRQRWRTLRKTEAQKEHGDSYVTPVLRRLADRTELVILGGECIDAYDAKTGHRTWFYPNFVGNRNISGPIVTGDTVVATQGMRGSMIALKIQGTGRQSEEQILWTHEKGTPDTPWPVVVDGLLFYVSDRGIAYCLDMANGKVFWKKRLPGSPFRASALTDGKNVYFTGTKGVTTVVRASKQFKKVAENRLDDRLYSSPVPSEGRLLLRGEKRLYYIGK